MIPTVMSDVLHLTPCHCKGGAHTLELDLHITNRCNLKCKHCIYDSNNLLMEDMTLSKIESLTDDFKKLGVSEIHLTGGEPLLNHQIFEIVKYLSEKQFTVRMQSNGMLVTEQNVRKLKDCGLKSILISIDGLEGNHNWLRENKNSYKQAISAIKHCKNVGLYCRANTVLHKKNVEDIFGILKETMRLGVDQHSFFYLTPGGRGKDLKDYVLTLEEWKNATENIISSCEKLNCRNKVKFQHLIVGKEDINECRILDRDNCLLLSDGNVYPCVFFVNSNYSLGNIKNESLCNIWSSEKNWNIYKFKPVNKDCACTQCKGGCRGLSYLLNKDPNSCDPRCQYKMNLLPGCIRKYVN